MENNLKEILFRRTSKARKEIEKFGDRSAIGSNAVNRWRVYESLLEEADLWDEFEKWEIENNAQGL